MQAPLGTLSGLCEIQLEIGLAAFEATIGTMTRNADIRGFSFVTADYVGKLVISNVAVPSARVIAMAGIQSTVSNIIPICVVGSIDWVPIPCHADEILTRAREGFRPTRQANRCRMVVILALFLRMAHARVKSNRFICKSVCTWPTVSTENQNTVPGYSSSASR